MGLPEGRVPGWTQRSAHHVADGYAVVWQGEAWCFMLRFFFGSGRPVVDQIGVMPVTSDSGDEALGRFAHPTDERSEGWAVPPAGLNTTTLRSLPLAELVQASMEDAMDFADGYGVTYQLLDERWIERLKDDRAPVKGGRPGNGEEFYAIKAARYAQLVAAGDPKPIATMTEHEPHTAEATVRGWIQKAARMGLLEGRVPGRPSGRLSARAELILQGRSDG